MGAGKGRESNVSCLFIYLSFIICYGCLFSKLLVRVFKNLIDNKVMVCINKKKQLNT